MLHASLAFVLSAQGTAGWTPAVYGAQPQISNDSTNTHGAGPSIRISSDQPSDAALGRDVAVSPGKLYRLSAWVKTAGLDPKGAPVYGTIQAQAVGGGPIASGRSLAGDNDWRQETLYFTGPANGKLHEALFLCGWGKGTGTVWFEDVTLQQIDVRNAPMRITTEPLCPGRINPMQYGQFIEFLCDLVPSMWAEKLYDGSFEGLSPYKFVFIKETDFKEKPWYPFGEVNRLKVEEDASTAISGEHSKKITVTDGPPAEGGIAQDGLSLRGGEKCRFSIYVKGSHAGEMHVRLFDGTEELAKATLPVATEWHKVSAALTSGATSHNATISIQFSGPGQLRLDSASLMPLDTVGGWRKDVVEVLKAVKPGVIRIGGSVLDDANLGTFEWKGTIGDPDRREPFRAWGGLQPTGAGIEEVVQLIRAAGAEPLICVRYEKKTPIDAAEEVQYFNGSVDTPMGALRAKNGHPEPYHIKYWQVGNERWGEEYWKAVPEFSKAMLAVDPNIKLLTSFPSGELIKGAAPYVEYVSPHQYDVHDMAGTRAQLDEARKLIEQNAGGKPLKVAVTEWNTTAGDAGLLRAGLWDLDNALACSRYQNLLHREADLVEIANRSNLTNSFCSGIIQTNRSTLYLTPTYYAQWLYANLAGTRPLKVESDIPVDASPDVSATLSEDGKSLTLFAVNESTSPVERVLDLSALGGGSYKAHVWTLEDTLHSGSPNACNSFANPKRVVPVEKEISVSGSTPAYLFPPLSLTVIRIPTNVP